MPSLETAPHVNGATQSPRDVIIIFKTHLDIGFTESAAKVRHDYINWQLFSALSVDAAVRARGRNFTWTVPSWVIWEALDLHRGKKLAQLEEGIAQGILAWHALPFTTHTEYVDASLLEFGLSLSARLDRRFGVKTIAAKMTDVPGHTVAMVPILAQAGVRFLHIGVNWACPKPDVPPLYRWRAATGEEVIVMHCEGYASDYQHPGGDAYLAFKMFGDNMDIASAEEVLAWFDDLEKKFPGARIRFGRLDDYAATLEPFRETLPVVTQEIGDTWIYGVGSDPLKTSQFRRLARLRNEWIRSGKLAPESKSFIDFSKNLLLIGEHTWSIAHVPMLAEEGATLDNTTFHQARPRGLYQTLEASTKEQRDYLWRAVENLRDTKFYEEARKVIQAPPAALQPSAGTEEKEIAGDLHRKYGIFTIGAKAGKPGLDSFFIEGLKGDLKAANQPLFTMEYQTFSDLDYDRFVRQYVRSVGSEPANAPDFRKPGLKETQAKGCFWPARLEARRMAESGGFLHLRESLSFPKEAQRDYGAPETAEVLLAISQASPKMEITISWRNKTATRRPEALWFCLGLALPSPENWRILKLGREIDPGNVVSKGGRKLHATDTGLVWRDRGGELRVTSHDAPLVSPGRPALGIFDDAFEPLGEGMHFLLWNNFWGTNFPAWSDEDARFGFELEWTEVSR